MFAYYVEYMSGGYFDHLAYAYEICDTVEECYENIDERIGTDAMIEHWAEYDAKDEEDARAFILEEMEDGYYRRGLQLPRRIVEQL